MPNVVLPARFGCMSPFGIAGPPGLGRRFMSKCLVLLRTNPRQFFLVCLQQLPRAETRANTKLGHARPPHPRCCGDLQSATFPPPAASSSPSAQKRPCALRAVDARVFSVGPGDARQRKLVHHCTILTPYTQVEVTGAACETLLSKQ